VKVTQNSNLHIIKMARDSGQYEHQTGIDADWYKSYHSMILATVQVTVTHHLV
jgi:hypothetical protein